MTREELLKIAKPILFNTEMVRAILDGRKTVTRRIWKDWNRYAVPDMSLYDADKRTYAVHTFEDQEHTKKTSMIERRCPVCPGDILYVRESVFQGVGHYLDVSGETVSVLTHDFEYYADGLHEKGHWKDKYERTWMHRRPSIHMPKEAARIFLKVTDVRVERLQDMGCEDYEKEGLEDFCKKCSALFSDCDTCLNDEGVEEDFKELWNSTIKKSDIDIYGWDADPYVWVIGFERIEV